jgi:DNA-binding MarR family transcriptional regulator
MWLQFMVHLRPKLDSVHAEFGLSSVQGHVLFILSEGARPMSDLAGALVCDASNVTGLVDRLEARGLLERRSADHDRRVKLLDLTDEGRKLEKALVERILNPPEAMRALPLEDQRALRDIMRRTLEGSGIELGKLG